MIEWGGGGTLFSIYSAGWRSFASVGSGCLGTSLLLSSVGAISDFSGMISSVGAILGYSTTTSFFSTTGGILGS